MKYPVLHFLMLTCLISSAQSHTISGYIEDADSKERIIGVNVFLKGTSYGTTSNTYGFYSLTVPEGEYQLVVSFIGYQNYIDSLSLTADHQIDINLEATSQELMEVEVTAEELPAEQAQMSSISLKAADIKKIPALMGEVDVIRAIQLLPGVQSGSEGTTGFYVRGGSPDQNLILLDGVPVYNASHLFGFFSVFNADAIKNVKLTKGGFPARFGGRLSSVLEIDMKEGNMKEFHGEGSIGLVASKLTLEGPIVKDKTSFMVSGRRTYIDALAAPFIASMEGYKAGYWFGDVTAKVNHVFSRKDRLYLSYYGGKDRFYYREEYEYGQGSRIKEIYDTHLQWGNNTGSLRWNHLFNDQMFGNLTATFSEYEFSTGYSAQYTDPGPPRQEEGQGFEYISRIRDMGLRYDMEYQLNAKHSLRFGGNYTYHSFTPGAAQIVERYDDLDVDSLLEFSEPIYSHDLWAYVEDDFNISKRWRANYGLHYSMYFVESTRYQSLQPRLSLRYLLRDDWLLKPLTPVWPNTYTFFQILALAYPLTSGCRPLIM
ncbi:MAG: carboxypeptidase-like regulatory domain-containing protein [Owenweeksia sp.]|nr:carboxypeptidase-like regulatory domain-containing protein [Owenweeksia sp.]